MIDRVSNPVHDPRIHSDQAEIESEGGVSIAAAFSYPHVASLTYRIESSESHEYDQRLEASGTIGPFAYEFKCREAVFRATQWFKTATDARAVLDPILEGWRILAEMEQGIGSMRFRFLRADERAGPPQPGVVSVTGTSLIIVGGDVKMLITHGQYPRAPTTFVVDDLTRDLAKLRELTETEPNAVLKHAFTMLSLLEYEFESRDKAADALGFAHNVFDQVRYYTTQCGTGPLRRKFKGEKPPKPFTDGDRQVLRAILLQVVLRAGALAAGTAFSALLTMNDFKS